MDALSARRQVTRIAAVAAPVVLAIANLTFPHGTFQYTGTREHALDALAATSAAPGRVRLASLLLVLGMALLVTTFCMTASLLRERGAALATWAMGLGAVGSVGAILVTSWLGLSVFAALQADISQDARAAYLVALTNDSGLGNLAGGCYFGGLVVGSLLMGAALLRARIVAWWLAVLFPVGVVMAAVAAPQGVLGGLFALPLLAVVLLLVRQTPVAAPVPVSAVPVAVG